MANSSVVSSVDRALTSLVFVLARLGVHEKADDRVKRTGDELEQHEANDNRLRAAVRSGDSQGRVKAERGEQGLVVDEQLEQSQGEQQVALCDKEEFGRVG